MNKSQRIVITGIGPISSVGVGRKRTWQNLLNAKTGLSEEKIWIQGELIGKYFLHKVSGFDVKRIGLHRRILSEIESWKGDNTVGDLDYFLGTIKLAIDDSKIIYNQDSNDVGLILTSESAGHGEFYIRIIEMLYPYVKSLCRKGSLSSEISLKDFFNDFYKHFKKPGYDLQTFMILFLVARAFRLHGYSLVINNACASGLYAIEAAADVIRSKKCSAMIVSAVDTPNIFKALWFRDQNVSPRSGVTKPFSVSADGFALGEGGAALIIESLESAERRKAKIYAEYIGGAFNLESWKVTLPAIHGGKNFYKRTIEDCIRFSKCKASEIDLVVPHGTASRMYDQIELESLTRIFNGRTPKPFFTTFKPYIGHNLGGSTLIEVSILLLCLENNCIIPFLTDVRDDLKINFTKKVTRCELRTALKTCTAFAGFNASCLFKKIG